MKRKHAPSSEREKRFCQAFVFETHIRDDAYFTGYEVKRMIESALKECNSNMEVELARQAMHYRQIFDAYIARGMRECNYVS